MAETNQITRYERVKQILDQAAQPEAHRTTTERDCFGNCHCRSYSR